MPDRPVEFIPIEKVAISEFNVRTQDKDIEIEDLKESIATYGLLQPVVVFKREDGGFDLIIGLRRYLAHVALQKEGRLKKGEIWAVIIPKPKDAIEAQTLSAVENLQRARLTRDDERRAYKILLKRYGSIKAVAKHLGYKHYTRIIQGIGYDVEVIPTGLRKLVEMDAITQQDAIELTLRNWPNIGRATRLGRILAKGKLDAFAKDRIIKGSGKEPGLSPEGVARKYRRAGSQVRLAFHLTGAYADGMMSMVGGAEAKTKRELTAMMSDSAKGIVEESLRTGGYVKE